MAQASKLLPGPALVVPLLFFLGWGGAAKRLLLAYLATTAAVILPFLLLDPGRFISSTVLFYLTFHARGDSTAMWFFVSADWKPWSGAVTASSNSRNEVAPSARGMSIRPSSRADLATVFSFRVARKRRV